jgi:UPF0755 protein
MRIVLGLVLLLGVIAAGAAGWGHFAFTGPGPSAAAITVVIPKGSGSEAIAEQLERAGIVGSRWVFLVGTKIRRASLKAGEYAFPAHVAPIEAMRILAEGRSIVHRLTIAEGLTVRQVRALVQGADFLAGPQTHAVAEGWLMPETWYMHRDDSREELVARMEKAMRQTLASAWVERAPGLALATPEQALILASIVERETAIGTERPMVAAVFLNRLAQGMRLQSDPTVIYGLSDGLGVIDHPLTRADLAAPHRWNTYVIDGLPPTPIANPGRASIEAVLHPAQTDALYFVADGKGGHVFARTLDEHNANVAAWRRVERARTVPAQ